MALKAKKKSLNVSDKLMKQVSRYDAKAFEDLYNQTSAAVFGYAMSIVGNRDDANDIVQATYISIYEKIQSYSPNGKAMAWIFTITRNHAYMLLRDQSKRNHVNIDDVYDIGEDTNIVEEVHNEMLVTALLDHLNEDERQIVVMHAMSDMKHKDIADVMDMPLSTVLSKYRRSLKKLKTLMEVNEYET